MFLKPQTTKSTQKQAIPEPASQPWVEKYRPKTIDDVSSQEHIVAVLQKTLTSTNLPHMLFYGPPGTGKTSTILALSRQLFGYEAAAAKKDLPTHRFASLAWNSPDNFRNRVLELNASDERGISIVREKIKNFARQTPRAQTVASDGKTYPCPPYKIIILDEADSMTHDAQSALRRIMESYARITRFCLVCNYVTRIIEPLTSRCSKFRFRPLDDSATALRIQQIANAEKVPVTSEVVDTLISVSGGDLRRSITYLQSASRLSSSTDPPTEITPQDVQEIAGVVPDKVVKGVGKVLGVETIGNDEDMDIDNTKARKKGFGFDDVKAKVKELIREGYSASQLLSQLHDLIILHPTLNARQKARCAMAFADADKALCDGADEELQILEVTLQVQKALV